MNASIRACIGVLAFAVAASASAQTFPDRPLRLIHGAGAGGNADIIARALAQPLGERLGQAVVVEARPGAGQAIGMSAVARAAADGYTLGGINAGISVSAAVNKHLPYDLLKDFAFVSMVSAFPFVIMTRPDSPLRSMADLVEAARKAPGKLSYGTTGVGTTQNLIGEMINGNGRIELVHVPYTSAGGPMLDLLGGRLDVVVDSLTANIGQLQTGKARALAVTSGKRWATIPDVPSMAETFPGFDVTSWTGIAVPAATPPAVIERLAREIRAVVGSDDFRKQLQPLGSLPFVLTPDETRLYVGREVAKWKEVAEKARIELR